MTPENWKHCFVEYMKHVAEEEGTTFLYDWDLSYFVEHVKLNEADTAELAETIKQTHLELEGKS